MTAVHPMGAMMANRPSPRPGFTYISREHATRQGPVVTVVSDSPTSVTTLERAAAESTRHSLPLHVVDACSSGRFKELLASDPESLEAEEVASALSILTRPDVDVHVVEGPETQVLLEYCSQVRASLLVVDLEWLVKPSMSELPLATLINKVNHICDLLIVIESGQSSSETPG